jgi:hypothetical protein
MGDDKVRVVSRLRKVIADAAGMRADGVDSWCERARLAVMAAYGETSTNLRRFDEISYSLGVWSDSTPPSAFDAAALRGVREAVAMLEAFVEDLDDLLVAEPRPAAPGGSQVFVVHGHDDAMREQVARMLTSLELEPVILQEQSAQGRTIIEKFEAHALQVGYAVVLLAPDDFGRGPDESDWPATPNRARQNVILELGYFMGSLGRARTAALYKEGTELPSDIHGMQYIPFDASWPLRLAKEMRDAGLTVDLNRL